ncbi:hypothetical protein [Peribacillus butanolivorans]|uniref:hypothetical protein n=1 Tax=Peribacillus butanolivorans TaxID=421767 RepID=UPI003661A616
MSNQHSFTITLSNNQTEKEGILYLQSQDPHFILPDSKLRKLILRNIGISDKFYRTFDMIYSPGAIVQGNIIIIPDITKVTLIELKTTKKRLPNNPQGFFFGATENEFNLAELLGDQYKFCFVCLHPDCPSHKLLSLTELDSIIRTKRIQYQINLGKVSI